jgi:hypothetical protein
MVLEKKRQEWPPDWIVKPLSFNRHLMGVYMQTICYNKSPAMLEACFRIYAWE